MTAKWKAYNELAWVEDWFTTPESYKEEVVYYISKINRYASDPPKTLLHLGSGAGGMDWIFKLHFAVTGVDISAGMLAIARAAHPEVKYIKADIRKLALDGHFDVVVIPDCIDYMTSLDDLNRTFKTVLQHLKPGGLLLLVAKTKETFYNNNFAYTGEKDGIHITLLENNFINPSNPDSYEATFLYLIREQNKLTMHTDRHFLGLFSQKTWEEMFWNHGFSFHQSSLHNVYEKYLLANGTYPMQVFVGIRKNTCK